MNPERGLAAAAALCEYFAPILEARRAEPTDDLISLLAAAEIDGEKLTDEEIFSFLRLLLPAGVETTYRSLGNLLFGLLSDTAQLEAVRADRSLLPQAIEEAVRWNPPLLTITRTTTCDTELGGVQIPEGCSVLPMLGSTNRQEDRWEDPDEFNIFRTAKGNLGWGHGVHVCLGMHLARLEMRTAINLLLDRLPNLRMDPDGDDPHIRGQVFRSPTSLPVLFDPVEAIVTELDEGRDAQWTSRRSTTSSISRWSPIPTRTTTTCARSARCARPRRTVSSRSRGTPKRLRHTRIPRCPRVWRSRAPFRRCRSRRRATTSARRSRRTAPRSRWPSTSSRWTPIVHAKTRGLLAKLITPKRLSENEEFMWRLADQQLDTFIDQGSCEFMADYAKPFAMLVIADLLGVPLEDHAEFRSVLGNEVVGEIGAERHRRAQSAAVAGRQVPGLHQRPTPRAACRRADRTGRGDLPRRRRCPRSRRSSSWRRSCSPRAWRPRRSCSAPGCG